MHWVSGVSGILEGKNLQPALSLHQTLNQQHFFQRNFLKNFCSFDPCAESLICLQCKSVRRVMTFLDIGKSPMLTFEVFSSSNRKFFFLEMNNKGSQLSVFAADA